MINDYVVPDWKRHERHKNISLRKVGNQIEATMIEHITIGTMFTTYVDMSADTFFQDGDWILWDHHIMFDGQTLIMRWLYKREEK